MIGLVKNLTLWFLQSKGKERGNQEEATKGQCSRGQVSRVKHDPAKKEQQLQRDADDTRRKSSDTDGKQTGTSLRSDGHISRSRRESVTERRHVRLYQHPSECIHHTKNQLTQRLKATPSGAGRDPTEKEEGDSTQSVHQGKTENIKVKKFTISENDEVKAQVRDFNPTRGVMCPRDPNERNPNALLFSEKEDGEYWAAYHAEEAWVKGCKFHKNSTKQERRKRMLD